MSQKYEYMFKYFKGNRCVGHSFHYDTLDEVRSIQKDCCPALGEIRVLFRRPVCEWEKFEIGKDEK